LGALKALTLEAAMATAAIAKLENFMVEIVISIIYKDWLVDVDVSTIFLSYL
jgi:hypothetical protein